MENPAIETETVYRVFNNEEGVCLSVGPCPDFPGNVLFSTADKDAAEYFGKIHFTTGTTMMRQIAQAMLRACDDADRRYPEYVEKQPRGGVSDKTDAECLIHAVFSAGLAAGVLQGDLPEFSLEGASDVLQRLTGAAKDGQESTPLMMSNSGRDSRYSVSTKRSGHGDIYQTLAIDIRDEVKKESVAQVLIGVDAKDLEPQIAVSSDGNRDRLATFINPLLDATEGVSISTEI